MLISEISGQSLPPSQLPVKNNLHIKPIIPILVLVVDVLKIEIGTKMSNLKFTVIQISILTGLLMLALFIYTIIQN